MTKAKAKIVDHTLIGDLVLLLTEYVLATDVPTRKELERKIKELKSEVTDG